MEQDPSNLGVSGVGQEELAPECAAPPKRGKKFWGILIIAFFFMIVGLTAIVFRYVEMGRSLVFEEKIAATNKLMKDWEKYTAVKIEAMLLDCDWINLRSGDFDDLRKKLVERRAAFRVEIAKAEQVDISRELKRELYSKVLTSIRSNLVSTIEDLREMTTQREKYKATSEARVRGNSSEIEETRKVTDNPRGMVGFLSEMQAHGATPEQASAAFVHLRDNAQLLQNAASRDAVMNKGLVESYTKQIELIELKVRQVNSLVGAFDKQFPTTHVDEYQVIASLLPKELTPATVSLDTRNNILGAKFSLIPPGAFQMGSNEGTYQNGNLDQGPEHQVTITHSFFLCTTEVTQGQWQTIMGSLPMFSKNPHPDLPAIGVSWIEVQNFINLLNERDPGKGYRLPTEAEWEFACHAGTRVRFYGVPEAIAVLNKFEPEPVGQKQPNAWGLFDMLGNANEWCQDWYDEHYYSLNPANDPQGPSSGTMRVMRGGCFTNIERGLSPTRRGAGNPANRYPERGAGFRLAMTAPN